mmetsp:Transcript_86691/g.193975  ORF Transcript_86691/g.193975 Transcript_86691/m.193975 type:complete len:289 (-) Transcript_86691:100-966(-)
MSPTSRESKLATGMAENFPAALRTRPPPTTQLGRGLDARVSRGAARARAATPSRKPSPRRSQLLSTSATTMLKNVPKAYGLARPSPAATQPWRHRRSSCSFLRAKVPSAPSSRPWPTVLGSKPRNHRPASFGNWKCLECPFTRRKACACEASSPRRCRRCSFRSRGSCCFWSRMSRLTKRQPLSTSISATTARRGFRSACMSSACKATVSPESLFSNGHSAPFVASIAFLAPVRSKYESGLFLGEGSRAWGRAPTCAKRSMRLTLLNVLRSSCDSPTISCDKGETLAK